MLAGLLATTTVCICRTTFAAPEELEVSFDLEQYSHNGSLSFSLGCTANPPTGRNNYVHITVVWLEDMNGEYVTTLYRWGRTYGYNLKAWAASSNMAVDGITRATPTSNGNNPSMVFHNFTTGPQDISWLPDGEYRIRLESTQCELADEFRSGTTNLFGPEATFTFTKGRTSQTDVNLGSAAPFNNVTVNYTVPGGNTPPGAWAGPDQFLMPSVVPADAMTTLDGVVDDDGGNPTVSWQLIDSEPSGLNANIASPNSAQTAVTFNAAGIYTFRLTATDGAGESSSDDVEVWVNAYALDATDDAEVASGDPNNPHGIIENAGPWVTSWGMCMAGQNYARGYFRFDLTGATGQITAARLRLPRAEMVPDSSKHHDFFILSDAQDDWNGGDPSTDWEGTLTFNNQPVPNGMASNLDPQQMVGTLTHDTCIFRHLFSDPDPPPGPGSDCPGWIDVDLDLSNVPAYDSNGIWSFFMTTREGCTNNLAIGSKENLINPQIVVVEHWQATVNQPPTADAGPDRVVTDMLPSGSELVTLDGSASSDDVGVTTYEWRENGQLLGSSPMPDGVTVPLALGVHDIELTVIDGAGLTGTDTVQVVVEDRFYSNRNEGEAPVIDGNPAGKLYADLFAYTEAPNGDWYALDLVDNTDLRVSVVMTGGDLDLTLYDSGSNVLMSSSTGALTESVNASALAAGRYYLQVAAAPNGASTYEMTVEVAGPTLNVTLNQASAVESAGTLSGAGTVSVSEAPAAPVDIMLVSDLPEHLGFGTNPVTLAAGATSVDFDIVLVDDPPGAPDDNRYVNITATAQNYNQGSAVFEILDDEASLVVTWDKAAEMVDETLGPLVVLTAQLSGTPQNTVTVPFTLGGTAEAGTDYEITGGLTELTIAGTDRTTLPISILDDQVKEDEETIIVTMGTPTGANPGSITEFVITIADDDEGGGGGDDQPDPTDTDGGCGCDASRSGGSPLGLLAVGLLLFLRRRRGSNDAG